jgi:hypothetical protein
MTARRWWSIVTAAETIGYLAPATAGVVTTKLGIDGLPQIAVMSCAGMLEGLALGTGQAIALPVAVSRRRFAMLTSLATGIVWASVMSAMQLAGSDAPPAIAIPSALVLGALALAVLGGAQWLELRRHVPHAHRWIGWTALAWIVALPASFLAAPLVDETTPMATQLVLWGAGGFVMAALMAAVTWIGVRRVVLPRHRFV